MLCSSNYTSFILLSALLSYFLPPPLFFLSCPLCFCALILPSSPPLLYFYLCLLLILHLLFSRLNAHVRTRIQACTHGHFHTHLSVISMRWFLMHLSPTGSSHSNLHQHPLPWLLVCLSVSVHVWVGGQFASVLWEIFSICAGNLFFFFFRKQRLSIVSLCLF